jgi:hypothetical protein
MVEFVTLYSLKRHLAGGVGALEEHPTWKHQPEYVMQTRVKFFLRHVPAFF